MSVGVIFGEKKRFFHWNFVLASVLAAVLFLVLSSSIAQAVTTVPTKMNFQGRLANSAGNILADGTYNMKFRIYNASSGGTLQWNEDRLVSASQGVTVTNGQFSVQLGSVTSLPASIFISNSLYFEVELPTPATATSSSPSWTEGPMTPRNQMATSAYAYNSETLDGYDSSDFAAVSGSANYIQNTTTPQTANLTIQGVANASAVVSITQGSSSGNLLVAGNGSTTGLTINSSGNTSVHGDLAVQNVSLAAGKTLTIAGDTTANRPASPTEGMIYYDTSTKQLLTYTNGKWQADRTEAVIVAASNSSQTDKDAADYVVDGNGGGAGDGDQVQINAALTAASGKKVVLLAGTYVADATILVPNNTTLAGTGNGTLVELADLDASDNLIENSDTTTGTGVTIRDLRLDGRKDLNTAGTQRGIHFTGMGGGTGSTARQGARITSVFVTSFRNENVLLTSSSHNIISNSTLQASSAEGLQFTTSSHNVVTGSKLQGNSASGFNANSTSSSNTITGNHAQGNGSAGFSMASGTYNTFSGNTSIGNSYGFFITSSTNTITGNTAQGNSSSGFYVSGSNNSLTGNTTNGGSYGFDIGGNNNDVTGNTTQSSTYGIIVDGDHTTISGNNITTASTYGIYLNGANSNVVTGNKVHDSGGATTNNSIYVQTSDSNSVSDNAITDSSATTTNYAINVSNATSDTNSLSDNSLGGGSINDLGTGTIYANQLDSSGQSINRTSGGFAIQGTAGTNLFSTAGTASVTIGASDTTGTVFALDTKTDAGDPTGIAGGMYYNSNAGKFRCYQVSAWKNCDDGGDAATVDGLDSTAFGRLSTANTWTGATTFQPGSDSTASFAIQNSSGSNLLVADSSNSRVYIGSQTADATGVVLVLDTKNTAGDPTGVAGAMYYNSTTQSFRCYQNGEWRSCLGGLAYANTSIPAGNTITASGAGGSEVNFASNYSIPAGDCQPGKVYRVTARGQYTTQALASPTLTVNVKLGSTTVGSTTATGTSAGMNNRLWAVDFIITCLTNGTSGTVEGMGIHQRYTAVTNAADTEMNTGTTTLNNTGSMTLQLGVLWSNSNAGNSITLRQLIVESIGP